MLFILFTVRFPLTVVVPNVGVEVTAILGVPVAVDTVMFEPAFTESTPEF